MKSKIIFILFLSMLQFSCNNSNSEKPKTAEELKQELKTKEEIMPTQYLTIENATMTQNLVREAGLFRDAKYDGWLAKGIIKNSATIAKYKDVVITIELYSQTETVIETKDYVIYEYYEPNSSKEFTIKINTPDATNKFHMTVKDATPVQ